MPARTSERQKHLGRGLESLLGPISANTGNSNHRPTTEQENLVSFIDKTLDRGTSEISLTDISTNPYQSRTHFDEEKLDELASSIRANGIIQPIVVRRTSEGFELIAGERRFRASKTIGLKTIPALVREASDEQMLEWALVENIHRADLNPIERAKAYESYMSSFNLTQTDAAERLGEDRSVVCNYVRLLQLPRDLCDMLSDGKLSMGHFRAILALPTDELKRKLANRALAGRLSVREIERLVRQHLDNDNKKKKQPTDREPHIVELEGKLTQQIGSRVKIDTQKSGKRGKIVIEFNSLDEFDSVLDRLGVAFVDNV